MSWYGEDEEENSTAAHYAPVSSPVSSEPQKVIDGLFIGSILATCSSARLKQLGITHVLSLCARTRDLNQEFLCKHIKMKDELNEDLIQYLPECHSFIKTGRDSGGVLVHCKAGSSRSAAVVISYLMNTNNMSYQDAFQFVQSKRPCIAPNRSFIDQLKRYESQLAKERQKKVKLQMKMILMQNATIEQQKIRHRPSLPPPIHRGKLTNAAKAFQIYQPRITNVTLS
eukprot:TRINITY_DN4996_c0_g2_i1.p1 TRINITY_DN4996_c0_g2~~TRINITY_DN4996_c0_g2_i1.p1  ORF type:complete len:227 (+),score=35.91 TRINITY_DN4996_c0_g2_i1:358-1038(+)